MRSKKIKLTCKGSTERNLDDLKNFQGDLKKLDKSECEKLKASILKHGFTFPVFVWENYVLDGHQRLYALSKLLDEGYSIGKLPVVEISAKTRSEAAEKLLVLNSRYGVMTQEGLEQFLERNQVDLEAIETELALPDVDLDALAKDLADDLPAEMPPEDNYAEQYGVIVICNDELDQEETYNFLREHGYQCKVVNT